MNYRVYIFDRFGRNAASIGIDGDDDEDAINIVTANSPGHLMELWAGDRLVKRFEAEAAPIPSASSPTDDPA